jgi:hypothetical protein
MSGKAAKTPLTETMHEILSRLSTSRHGRFPSKLDLTYFNETMAEPMNWTYTGRPTHSQPNQRPRTWRELRQTEKPWKKHALVETNLQSVVLAPCRSFLSGDVLSSFRCGRGRWFDRLRGRCRC